MLLYNANLSDLAWAEQAGALLFFGKLSYSFCKDNYQGWLVHIWETAYSIVESY